MGHLRNRYLTVFLFFDIFAKNLQIDLPRREHLAFKERQQAKLLRRRHRKSERPR
jgi:hypothetical protein